MTTWPPRSTCWPAGRTGRRWRPGASWRRAAVDRDGTAAVVVVLAAQEQAMGFYARCGYTVLTGRSYLDAGIAHQDMARLVTR